ncbi:hypothetical protein CBS147346_1236 [Aspergillus niger]|nr:hypothetical protein CBS147346_1236 [Aspergillus niger]
MCRACSNGTRYSFISAETLSALGGGHGPPRLYIGNTRYAYSPPRSHMEQRPFSDFGIPSRCKAIYSKESPDN